MLYLGIGLVIGGFLGFLAGAVIGPRLLLLLHYLRNGSSIG